MIIGIRSLHVLLDRGNQEGWWQSGLIDLLTFTATLGLSLIPGAGIERPAPHRGS